MQHPHQYKQDDGSEIIEPLDPSHDDGVFAAPSIGGTGGWTRERLQKIPTYKAQIVDGLASGLFPSEICQQLGFGIRAYTDWRERDSNFDEACSDAIEANMDRVEREAIRRAVDGIEDVVVSQGRVVMDPRDPTKPLMQRKYSDNLMMFILRGRRREVYGEKVETTNTHKLDVDTVKDTLARKLGALAPPPNIKVVGDADE